MKRLSIFFLGVVAGIFGVVTLVLIAIYFLAPSRQEQIMSGIQEEQRRLGISCDSVDKRAELFASEYAPKIFEHVKQGYRRPDGHYEVLASEVPELLRNTGSCMNLQRRTIGTELVFHGEFEKQYDFFNALLSLTDPRLIRASDEIRQSLIDRAELAQRSLTMNSRRTPNASAQ